MKTQHYKHVEKNGPENYLIHETSKGNQTQVVVSTSSPETERKQKEKQSMHLEIFLRANMSDLCLITPGHLTHE